MQITVEIPDIWRPVAASTATRIAVEHAPLDIRALETLLALALASERPDQVLLTSQADRVRHTLARWLGAAAIKAVNARPFRGITLGERTIWVGDLKAALDEALPFSACGALYVTDAHRIDSNPVRALGTLLDGPAILCGEASVRGHWWSDYVRGADVHYPFPVEPVIEAFPDQEARLPEDRVTREYQRAYELQEEGAFEFPVLSRFVRDRMRVRTDKGPEFLSETQQAEAERDLGAEWATGRVGSPVVSFELTPLQRRYLALKRVGRMRGFRRFLVLKYRRGGITTTEQAISYHMAVNAPRSFVTTLAQTDADTRKIFRIASTFHELDPQAPRRVNDAATSLEFSNGSLFYIGTAGAKGFARGSTIQRAHCSEVAHWLPGPHQVEDVEKLMVGLVNAARNGEIVLESTPNGLEYFAQAYREAKLGRNSFWPIFFAWFHDPFNVARPGTFNPDEIRETLTDEETELATQHRLTLGQIAFRREQIKANGARLFLQEYPEDDESCFLATGQCFFEIQSIRRLLRILPAVPKEEIRGGYRIQWEPPQEGKEYRAGVDTSEGLATSDPNGIGVVEYESGRMVYALHGRWTPRELAGHVIETAKLYPGIVGIERNNHGHAVINQVENLGHGRAHDDGGWLYHQKPGRPGVVMDAQTRDPLLDELARAVEGEDSEDWVRDRDFLGECLTFRKQRNGKYEADSGAHDDGVIKWAWARWMRRVRRQRPGMFFVEDMFRGE